MFGQVTHLTREFLVVCFKFMFYFIEIFLISECIKYKTNKRCVYTDQWAVFYFYWLLPYVSQTYFYVCHIITSLLPQGGVGKPNHIPFGRGSHAQK